MHKDCGKGKIRIVQFLHHQRKKNTTLEKVMRCLVPGNNTYRQVQMFKEADKQRDGETWNVCLHAQLLTLVQLFETLWTIVCQAPLSMEFSRQECWSGLPFPPLPNPVTEPTSPRAPSLCRWFFFFNHWATWEAPTYLEKTLQRFPLPFLALSASPRTNTLTSITNTYNYPRISCWSKSKYYLEGYWLHEPSSINSNLFTSG